MKALFSGQSSYQRPTHTEESKHDSPYAYWVDLTAKLIGRSYIQTHGLVKTWPLHKIERRYKEAMNCNRELTTPVKRWWSLRKQDKSTA